MKYKKWYKGYIHFVCRGSFWSSMTHWIYDIIYCSTPKRLTFDHFSSSVE